MTLCIFPIGIQGDRQNCFQLGNMTPVHISYWNPCCMDQDHEGVEFLLPIKTSEAIEPQKISRVERSSSSSSMYNVVQCRFKKGNMISSLVLKKGNVVITGTSSGLGLATAKALAETGKWHVIMACRDFLKTERAAKSVGMNKDQVHQVISG